MKSTAIDPRDIVALVRDKYNGNKEADITEDLQRLASGEPLAYVIGWIPFLNLKIYLEHLSVKDLAEEVHHVSLSRPLIPRPETEWWTEKLIEHLKYKFEDRPFTLLDLCAGSGAIGLAILSALPNAHVSFGEIIPELKSLIQQNLTGNNLNETRADIRTGDLFLPFAEEHFDIIATNPPYIPDQRPLEESVTDHEPHEALFSGADGLDLIRRIAREAKNHLTQDGELWMECDISNIAEAEKLVATSGRDAETTIHIDQYGRPRLLISIF